MIINSKTGLNPAEQVVYDLLVEAAEAYKKLPVEHTSEPREFVDAVHRQQDLLAARIARRDYPAGWKMNV